MIGRVTALTAWFLVLAFLVPPALAQRSRCGFGAALEAVRAADRVLAGGARLDSLAAGREAAASATERLREAAMVFVGCGCRRAAPEAAEAAAIAEQAVSEASVARIRAMLDRARFSLGLLRERLGRSGCA